MTKKNLLIAMLASLSVIACNETTKNETDKSKKTETISDTKNDVFGTYEGTSPGANSLVKETLILQSDYNFTQTIVYVDKSNEAFTEKGTFKIEKDKVILDVDHQKSGGYYKIFDDYLLMLDISGKEITSENAEMYKMKKLKN